MDRRQFINRVVIGGGALAVSPLMFASGKRTNNAEGGALGLQLFKSNRPPVEKRMFTSQAVEQEIIRIKSKIADPEIAWLFENCYPNTLDTTVHFSENGDQIDSFIVTGDIDAMWLRDSTAQVWPYLHLINHDEQLKKLFIGLINRQTQCILIDPYANAFNFGKTGSHWETDITEMKPELHERKWEIDSLCYPTRLSYHYWKQSGDQTPFNQKWLDAARTIVSTFEEQQRFNGNGPYSFMRVTEKQSDTVINNGFGNPIKPNGLICSTFRPSDDATTYLFLIPSNYFAMVTLRQLGEMVQSIFGETKLASKCNDMANTIEKALKLHAASNHLNYGNVLAFEVDGFGNRLFMDDANIPSLLSLPYLGCMNASDQLYQNTRRFVLSNDNPWFFQGKAASGIGGPHIGIDMIWPMSLIMAAMTSTNDNEITQYLHQLKTTHAGSGFMHESFHKDQPETFTRAWFAWVNTLFGELIIKLSNEKPEILSQTF